MSAQTSATSAVTAGCALAVWRKLASRRPTPRTCAPVWAKAISAQGTVKATPGSVNVAVVCAGATVHAGDVIVGDADGVCVVPRAAAAEIARLVTERVAKEEKTRERLRKGELGLDLYGFRAKLAELGVRYVDEP